MAHYIKVNPKVAKFLHLENDRNTVKDGNYLLWQADMLAFGPLTQLGETIAMIGAIVLLPHEAREEQEGTVVRELPQPTDTRFVMVGEDENMEVESENHTSADTAMEDNTGKEDEV